MESQPPQEARLEFGQPCLYSFAGSTTRSVILTFADNYFCESRCQASVIRRQIIMRNKEPFIVEEIDFESGGMKETVLLGKERTAALKKLADKKRSAFMTDARRQVRMHLLSCLSKAANLRGDSQRDVHFDIVVTDGHYTHTDRNTLFYVEWAHMIFTDTIEQALIAGWKSNRRPESIPPDFQVLVRLH